jgi:hypothetical protein
MDDDTAGCGGFPAKGLATPPPAAIPCRGGHLEGFIRAFASGVGRGGSFCNFGAGATRSGARVGWPIFVAEVPAFEAQDGSQVGSHTPVPQGRSHEILNGIRRNSSAQPVLNDQPCGTLTKLQPVQAISIAPSATDGR